MGFHFLHYNFQTKEVNAFISISFFSFLPDELTW